MIKILLCGASGAMGNWITEVVDQHPDFEITCGLSLNGSLNSKFSTVSKFDSIDIKQINAIDVIIDFSNATLTDQLLTFSVEHQLPLVLCTTGLSNETEIKVLEASEKIPIFKSGNMSLGINVLSRVLKQASIILGNLSDIDIVEKHHNRKVDAPSGTALMLAEATNSGLEVNRSIVLGREKEGSKDQSVINIHSVRGGNIVGEHEVIFSYDDERITFSHGAYSRRVFANGALNAAHYIIKQKPGLYDMSQMLDDMITL